MHGYMQLDAMTTALSTFLSAPILAHGEPAGGAALDQVAIATGAAVAGIGLIAWLGMGHHSGRVPYLGRAADFTERASGLPGWAALPSALCAVSLLVALLGMYWDISLHIDVGRDPGPLANPAHYLILAGLFGIFSAGWFAVSLPKGRPGPAAVRLTGNWYAPVGGLLIASCGAFSLIGFPLDDIWHRLFGQDVTLWGPTHLMLIGGAGLSLLGMAILMVEGGPPVEHRTEGGLGDRVMAFMYRTRFAGVCGGLLVGLSTFQAEFDFGVPQFRLLFEPVLIVFAAGVALVAARTYAGRGAALIALLYFVVVRGGLALLVGPVLGEPTPHFPLYAVEALIVEGVALGLAPRRGPIAYGAVCGALIGTVGFASEYAWSHLFLPISWPQALVGESLVVVPLTAIAAGML